MTLKMTSIDINDLLLYTSSKGEHMTQQQQQIIPPQPILPEPEEWVQKYPAIYGSIGNRPDIDVKDTPVSDE